MTQLPSFSQKARSTLITQGEYAVSDESDLYISTLLGSCVSCCLWDDIVGAGGMNHLLLAGEKLGNGSGYNVAGVAEMERLINGIIKLGGRRERLKAKVFGGSNMLGNQTTIGQDNAKFAFDFLAQENIECQNASVGGTAARALRFWPATGKVNMRMVSDAPPEPVAPKPQASAGNDLELF